MKYPSIIVVFTTLALVSGCGRDLQATQPVRLPPTVEPVRLPPTVEPVRLPPTVKPVRLPPTVEPVRLPPTVEPVPSPRSLSITGTWWGRVRYDNKLFNFLYIFNDDGSIEEKDLNEQVQIINEARGSYTLADGKVIINWPPATEERASVAWINPTTFLYMITAHTDEQQVGSLVVFHRFAPITPLPYAAPAEPENVPPVVSVPASEPSDALPSISGLPGPNGDGSYGPFATIRRAEEVANMFRNMGYPHTIQYHNGDGQYVFPRR